MNATKAPKMKQNTFAFIFPAPLIPHGETVNTAPPYAGDRSKLTDFWSGRPRMGTGNIVRFKAQD